MRSDKLLILHHGALGDLLCAWPALLALAGTFADARRYALVRASHHFLLQPLGYLACPDELRGVEDAFHGGILPPAASEITLFRFCLGKLPGYIPEGAYCITALCKERIPVFQSLLAQLEALGLPVPCMEDCLMLFRKFFGGWKGQGSRLVGILPGSGHKVKNWPPEYFAEIARELTHKGFQPVQILGQAELERNICLPGIASRCPQGLAELVDILVNMRLVFGNDSGPVHLAAYLGIPCAVLFGPSDARRWGPPGARCLCSPLPCVPCTDDMSRLGCTKPECMDKISVKHVLCELLKLIL